MIQSNLIWSDLVWSRLTCSQSMRWVMKLESVCWSIRIRVRVRVAAPLSCYISSHDSPVSRDLLHGQFWRCWWWPGCVGGGWTCFDVVEVEHRTGSVGVGGAGRAGRSVGSNDQLEGCSTFSAVVVLPGPDKLIELIADTTGVACTLESGPVSIYHLILVL